MHVNHGTLEAAAGQVARNSQLWLYDPADQATARSRSENVRAPRSRCFASMRANGILISQVRPDTIGELGELLQKNNCWAPVYQNAAQLLKGAFSKVVDARVVIAANNLPDHVHKRRQNAQTGGGIGELAMIITGETAAPSDIILRLQPADGDPFRGVRTIDYKHQHRDALKYPLLFFDGTTTGPPAASPVRRFADMQTPQVGTSA